jgi:hypothetical protein
MPDPPGKVKRPPDRSSRTDRVPAPSRRPVSYSVHHQPGHDDRQLQRDCLQADAIVAGAQTQEPKGTSCCSIQRPAGPLVGPASARMVHGGIGPVARAPSHPARRIITVLSYRRSTVKNG